MFGAFIRIHLSACEYIRSHGNARLTKSFVVTLLCFCHVGCDLQGNKNAPANIAAKRNVGNRNVDKISVRTWTTQTLPTVIKANQAAEFEELLISKGWRYQEENTEPTSRVLVAPDGPKTQVLMASYKLVISTFESDASSFWFAVRNATEILKLDLSSISKDQYGTSPPTLKVSGTWWNYTDPNDKPVYDPALDGDYYDPARLKPTYRHEFVSQEKRPADTSSPRQVERYIFVISILHLGVNN